VTVAPGDTLSTISAATCGTASDWSGIYAANRPPLSDPDVISAGQVLRVRCADPGYTPPAPPPAPAPVRQPVQVAAAPAPAQPAAQPAATYSGSGSMQSCIIAAESGGNSQIVNASGHYGLYQFSYATWVAHGGNGADFGHASVAEQNQVYASTVAADGYSDWAPYDGC
jgi:nucleoid-associated protein YgaU